jgi:hypothetical protein
MKLPRSPARAVHRSKSGSLMSGLGHLRQTETLPALAACPLAPKADMRELASIRPLRAISGLMHSQQTASLFDYFVGARGQRRRCFKGRADCAYRAYSPRPLCGPLCCKN